MIEGLPLFDHAIAERRRDRGIGLAAEAQDRSVPDWGERAYEAIARLAEVQAEIHVDDVLRVFMTKPEHPNAWGSVWQRAIRDGLIERTGRVKPSADAKKNSHNYPIYRSAAYRGPRQ